MDEDDTKNVMIALLPSSSEWCQIDIPHLTLVYCGMIADNNPIDFNKMAKDTHNAKGTVACHKRSL